MTAGSVRMEESLDILMDGLECTPIEDGFPTEDFYSLCLHKFLDDPRPSPVDAFAERQQIEPSRLGLRSKVQVTEGRTSSLFGTVVCHLHEEIDSSSFSTVVAGQSQPDYDQLRFLVDAAHELNMEVAFRIVGLPDT